MSTRRDFFKQGSLGVAALGLMGCNSPQKTVTEIPFELGLASYTLRAFDLDTTLKMTNRLQLKNIALKSMHLPYESDTAALKAAAKKVKDAGINLYGCGVVYMRKKEDVDMAFKYAKSAGMKMIIGVPAHDLLKYTNEKIKEYDISVAIHNHGPTDKVYPTPQSAYELIKDLDPRFGVCIDVGHTMRAGICPAETAIELKDRVLDFHIKDVSEATKDGKTLEIGHGVMDIPKILKALIKINYQGVCSFEYEKDQDDPMPGLAESVGYVRGVLEMI